MPIEAYRFTIEGISTGNQCQNVLHFLGDNDDDATPLAMASELVNKWNTTFKAPWLAEQSNRYGLRWVQAKRILPSGGNSYWKEYPEGTDVGAVNEEQAALQCSPIVKLFGGLATPTQGRIFMPSPPEGVVLDNVVDATYTTDVLNHIAALQSFSDTHSWFLAIYSKKNGNAVAVTSATISNIIGNMGKRRIPL